ncbi:MAG: hypothetical protein WB524_22200 [Acidobacteriaceae bacterium]
MSADNPNQRAVQQLLREAEFALAAVGLTTSRDDREAVAQALAAGHQAWQDIVRRQQALTLTVDEAAALQSCLDRLRARLRFLGLTV